MNMEWFNTIIMAIIYSKYSRELLLKTSKLSSRHEPLAKLLYQLLKKDKNLKIDLNTFKILKPTVELFTSLNLNANLIEFILKYAWSSWSFIIYFFKYLDTSYLALDYYKHKLYFGVRENLNIHASDGTIMYKLYEPITNDYADKTIKKLIKDNQHPNYITVNVWGPETYNDIYITYINLMLSKENVGEKLNLDSHKSIKYDGIKEMSDEILYNNYKYKLDSVILDNYKNTYNNSDISHDNRYGMVGITNDKDVKYAYNSQPRIIGDHQYNLIYSDAKKILPCEYIEYKWDQLNSRKKLIVSKSLCNNEIRTLSGDDYEVYNFAKGIRTLVYVKQERIYKSKSKSSEIKKREKKQRNDIKIKINNYKEKIKEIKEKINIEKKELEKIKKRY